MTVIITHGDADGICSAALVKMTPKHRNDNVIFSHPMGLEHDLPKIDEDLIVLDIAIDLRSYSKVYPILDILSQKYSVLYLDHHGLPGPLPPKVEFYNDERVGTTELAYRYFYNDLPKFADRIACIGSICDYCDDTPVIKELMYCFERRSLFLDAGLLAQGLRDIGSSYDAKRELVEEFALGKYPCELKELTRAALKVTQDDKDARKLVLQMYETGKRIAWVISPPASKSKSAHWIMGDSGKMLGVTVNFHKSKEDLADITIRGRDMVDLREIIPRLAQNLGGSGGGHKNAIGCRIPRFHLESFLKILDKTLVNLDLSNPPDFESLIDLDR
jgi:RecJ-like exonuclease